MGRHPPAERIRMTVELARLVRIRKFEFDAWLVYEAGKTWPEADADVSEAIDFCEYYAREMARLAGPQPVVQLPGEHDEMIYIPLGVGVVISAMEFPAGHHDGDDRGLAGHRQCRYRQALERDPDHRAKSPSAFGGWFSEDEFHAPDRSGAAVGDVLVQHPKTRYISFTGSRDVGLRINELAAKTQPGQIWIKRVIAEMGAKTPSWWMPMRSRQGGGCVLFSAFGYQGQKCSACSRAIVDASVYDRFFGKAGAQGAGHQKWGRPTNRGTSWVR